jgi:hypothetical protein
MLRRLYEEGIVSETDYNLLTESYRLRNNAIHGFKVQFKKRDAGRLFKTADTLIQALDKED